MSHYLFFLTYKLNGNYTSNLILEEEKNIKKNEDVI